jgi:hypothetical protein
MVHATPENMAGTGALCLSFPFPVCRWRRAGKQIGKEIETTGFEIASSMSRRSRLEDRKALAQRLTSIKQRQHNNTTQQSSCLSVRELSQECHRPLTEIMHAMLPSKIPQLENMLTQAVGEHLCKKLLQHLVAILAAAIDENVQCFSDILLIATGKEDNLKTVMNIAERAAFQGGGQQPYGPRGTPQCN